MLAGGTGGLGANGLLGGLNPTAALMVAQSAGLGRPPLTDLTLSNLAFGGRISFVLTDELYRKTKDTF